MSVADGGTAQSTAEIREALRRELPQAAFSARPLRALWLVPLVAVAAMGTWTLAQPDSQLVVLIAALVVVGNVYAAMLLLAHEIMHGAVVRVRWLQHLLAWIGLAPFLIPPTLWRTWHNEVHHGHANERERDPDTFACESSYASSWTSRVILRAIPGSGGVASFVFPLVWFCAHGQIVLWFLSTRMSGFERLDRNRCKRELAITAIAWLALAAWLGPRGAAVAILAPMAVGNCILMSYIATNHLLRPLGEKTDALLGAMSVATPAPFDRLHFRFSHHVEHHLFPAMSGRDLPLVRAWLLRHAVDRFVCVSHPRAIRALYATPRTYRDLATLVDPRRPERAPIDLHVLARTLGRNASAQDQQTMT